MSGAEWKVLILSSLAYTIGASVALYGQYLGDWRTWLLVILGAVVTIPSATAMILIRRAESAS